MSGSSGQVVNPGIKLGTTYISNKKPISVEQVNPNVNRLPSTFIAAQKPVLIQQPVLAKPVDPVPTPIANISPLSPESFDFAWINNYFSANGFSVDRELGRGAFGITYLGVHSSSVQIPLAIKVVKYTNDVLAELNVLEKLKHQCNHHIICYEGYSNDDKYVYIYTQYVLGMDVDKYIYTHPGINILEFLDKFITDMLVALTFIHSQGIIHRDIKPSNVLYSPEPSDSFTLVDFGGGCVITCTNFTYSLTFASPYILQIMSTGRLPSFQEYTYADLYAVGICIWELLRISGQISGEYRSLKELKSGMNVNKDLNWSSNLPSVFGHTVNDVNQIFHMLTQEKHNAGELLQMWNSYAYNQYFHSN
jgi:serine/threonine protein kinase